MITSTIKKAPKMLRKSVAINTPAMMSVRIVFAIRKTIVYTIHGTSSIGLSCKERKQEF
jgi:hypothetical protein